MKVSELIVQLQQFQEQHGDLDVETWDERDGCYGNIIAVIRGSEKKFGDPTKRYFCTIWLTHGN